MFELEVVEAVQHLANADPARCDSPELSALVATSARVRAWLDACDVRLAQQASDLAAAGSGCVTERRAGRWRTARRTRRRCRQSTRRHLRRLPDVQAALAAGDLSAGHVDAIARTAANLDDTARTELAALQSDLIAKAATSTVDEFNRDMGRLERILFRDDGLSKQARSRRDRNVRRWVDRNTGMCHTHLQLDAETDARVAATLDAAVAAARARHARLRADVRPAAGRRPRRPHHRRPNGTARAPRSSRCRSVVLIDLQTLRPACTTARCAETADGTRCPRRRSAGCAATPTSSRSCSAATARSSTSAGPAAWPPATNVEPCAAMHPTCGLPDCTVPLRRLPDPPRRPWDHGGPTDLDNLLPLCTTHHHLVHEGGWTLTLAPGPHHHPDPTRRHHPLHGPTALSPPTGSRPSRRHHQPELTSCPGRPPEHPQHEPDQPPHGATDPRQGGQGTAEGRARNGALAESRSDP